jgi:hypothetical protein
VAFPVPVPGLVVRYDFLWSDESAAGKSARKDRPSCILVAIDTGTGSGSVVLLPITHTEPSGDTVGIEIPQAVKRHLGLDSERGWIVVSQYNVDEWPNPGLSPVQGKADGFSYGFVPPGLFAQVKEAFLAVAHRRGVQR